MGLLSEGVVTTPGIGASTGGKPVSSPPPAVDSLLVQYEQILSEVRPFETRKLRMIWLKGEGDLEAALQGPAKIRILETREQRNKRIVRMYEGWTATEVAVAEDCSEGYIRKIRKENDDTVAE